MFRISDPRTKVKYADLGVRFPKRKVSSAALLEHSTSASQQWHHQQPPRALVAPSSLTTTRFAVAPAPLGNISASRIFSATGNTHLTEVVRDAVSGLTEHEKTKLAVPLQELIGLVKACLTFTANQRPRAAELLARMHARNNDFRRLFFLLEELYVGELLNEGLEDGVAQELQDYISEAGVHASVLGSGGGKGEGGGDEGGELRRERRNFYDDDDQRWAAGAVAVSGGGAKHEQV